MHSQIVAPKRERLAEAEEEVRERMGIVEGKRNELRQLEEKLENLQRRFSLSCREKEKLENEQKLCGLKLERARKLISMEGDGTAPRCLVGGGEVVLLR